MRTIALAVGLLVLVVPTARAQVTVQRGGLKITVDRVAGADASDPLTALFTIENQRRKPIEVTATFGGDGVKPTGGTFRLGGLRSVVKRRPYPSNSRSIFIRARVPGRGGIVAVSPGEHVVKPAKPPTTAITLALSGGLALFTSVLVAVLTHLFTQDREKRRALTERAEANRTARIDRGIALFEDHKAALQEFARLWSGETNPAVLRPAVAELELVPFQELKATAHAALATMSDAGSSEDDKNAAARELSRVYDNVVRAPWDSADGS